LYEEPEGEDGGHQKSEEGATEDSARGDGAGRVLTGSTELIAVLVAVELGTTGATMGGLFAANVAGHD